jgi:hypothetical protein
MGLGQGMARAMRRVVIDESLARVRQGDVLKWPSGTMRVVRVLHDHGVTNRYEDPRKVFCYFTIKHCSWTHRCYTLYNLGELHGMGVRNTGMNIKFKTRFDERLVEEMENSGQRTIKCCAVRGMS